MHSKQCVRWLFKCLLFKCLQFSSVHAAQSNHLATPCFRGNLLFILSFLICLDYCLDCTAGIYRKGNSHTHPTKIKGSSERKAMYLQMPQHCPGLWLCGHLALQHRADCKVGIAMPTSPRSLWDPVRDRLQDCHWKGKGRHSKVPSNPKNSVILWLFICGCIRRRVKAQIFAWCWWSMEIISHASSSVKLPWNCRAHKITAYRSFPSYLQILLTNCWNNSL